MTKSQEESATVAGICFLMCFLLIILGSLFGCAIPVQHSLNIPLPAPAKGCPPLMPIPAKMMIDIDGERVDVDKDGEAFLRGYVSTRLCLRGAP